MRRVYEEGELFLQEGNEDVLLRDLVRGNEIGKGIRKGKQGSSIGGGRVRGRRSVVLASSKCIIQKEFFECEAVLKGDKWIALKGMVKQKTFRVQSALSMALTLEMRNWCSGVQFPESGRSGKFQHSEVACVLCGEHNETVQHLFFTCLWRKTSREIWMILFFAAVWCIWKSHNDKVFGGKQSGIEEMFREVISLKDVWFHNLVTKKLKK
ncbi:hypothetical protein PIB30_044766 [Stylosanthes scabra]|uniref:Reverse transcriptase zinc-binding domain-containing protein n=1 Tax=Stylosanthes scabra TaxID=79078 RepID=A0ABU6QFJ7_9FABA|nr:hypothetical protein [Stylosanthes scabra]